jgi:tetratricopeptide (TPR) repeat protein
VQELGVRAWIAQARGDPAGALELMRAAAGKEDLSEKSSVSPGRLIPARELLGDMLLEDGRPAEALAAYETSQKRDPKRFRTLWGAARAAEASGDLDRARKYYNQLADMAGTGEPRPELVAARAWLAEN